jgi:hypothetical protein
MSEPGLNCTPDIDSKRVKEVVSVPERELLDFIGTVTSLIGTGATDLLKQIWLDELACMDYLPSPTRPDWRRVSFAASARLASRIIEVQLGDSRV